ncbi:MAG: flagellar biosynthetic protein FliR [Nitrospirota bacterium]|nr:flagellar biosynthetic protein FliR [Nitrospirota bacterium]MDH4360585.1 flagellar biosynthetic protein FliR [Nitrospirota bacterium]MDH5296252.1 flagellar biosynthetic protein FliR [Nitrospirota bacterium]MDH5574450.1 flagellar biosynthetic protein FliR [Nitrospirota bacterium]
MLQWDFAIQQIWQFLVVLVRTAVILSALPLLGGVSVPTRIKLGMAVIIAVLLTPVVTFTLPPNWLEPGNLVLVLGAELLVGLVLGLAMRLIMTAVELAGSVMGFQVGFAMAGVLDPVTQVETPVFGQLLTILATLLYFQVDGHHLVLLALGSSFQLIPPFGAHLGAPLLTDVTGLIQRTYDTGLKLAFPVMAATFLIHITMGLLGRLVPQMNIMLTSFPITIAMGLLVLGLGLPFIALVFQDSIVGMESILWELLQELGHG